MWKTDLKPNQEYNPIPQGQWVTLVPTGEKSGTFITNPTTYDEYFWQPPND
jgi:hypothetical protein